MIDKTYQDNTINRKESLDSMKSYAIIKTSTTNQRGLTMRYKLDVKRDVDADDDGYILNLPRGFRFDDDLVHVRGFDTMRELRAAVKTDVIECHCSGCAATN